LTTRAAFRSILDCVAAAHPLPASLADIVADWCEVPMTSVADSEGAGRSRFAAEPSMEPLTPDRLRLLHLEVENLVRSGVFPGAKSATCGLKGLDAFKKVDWTAPAVLRLLLLGSQDPSVRTVGFPPKLLTREEYVLGDAGGWPGLMPVAEGFGSRPARVRIRLDLAIGLRRVVVERVWIALTPDWCEDLVVDDDGELIEGADAALRLSEILPRELVPLFIFEGFDVLGAAFSSSRLLSDLDRLLPGDFLDALYREVRDRAASSSPDTDVSSNFRPPGERLAVRRMRRARTHAVARQAEVSRRIRSVMARLSDTRRELALVSGLLRTLPDRPKRSPDDPDGADRPHGIRGRIALPGRVGLSASEEDEDRAGRDEVELRIADLGFAITRLVARLAEEQIEARMWTGVVVARQRSLDADLAPDLASGNCPRARSDAAPADHEPIVRSIEAEFRRRIRSNVQEALAELADALTVPFPISAVGLAGGETGSTAGSARVTSAYEPGAAGLDLPSALTLRLALLAACGRDMPVFAEIDVRTLSRDDRLWLERRFRPRLPEGSVLVLRDGPSST